MRHYRGFNVLNSSRYFACDCLKYHEILHIKGVNSVSPHYRRTLRSRRQGRSLLPFQASLLYLKTTIESTVITTSSSPLTQAQELPLSGKGREIAQKERDSMVNMSVTEVYVSAPYTRVEVYLGSFMFPIISQRFKGKLKASADVKPGVGKE